MKRYVLYIFLVCLTSMDLLSQNDTINSNNLFRFDYQDFEQNDSINVKNNEKKHKITKNEALDSIKRPFNSYSVETITHKNNLLKNDSLIDFVSLFLPHQSFTLNPIGISIPGSPVISARYSQKSTNEFWFLDNYSPYVKTHNNVLFFDANKPYTLFKFYSGGQEQEILEFLHTQNINSYLNFAFNYNLINWLGQLQHYKSKTNSLSFSTAYTKHKYQSYFDFIYNKISHYENAGIADLHSFENTNYPLNNYTVKLMDAENKIRQVGFQYNQEYRLGGYTLDTIYRENDSCINKIVNSNFSIIHEISANKYYRVYKDKKNYFYPIQLRDSVQTNDSTVFNTINNKIALNFSLENKGNIKEIKIITGIKNKFNNYKYDFYQEKPSTKAYFSHYIFGNIRFEISRLSVNSNLDYCFAGWNIFDSKFDISARYRIINNVYINAKYELSALKPNIFLYQYSSNHFEWKAEKFNKTINSSMHADLELKKRKIKLGMNAYIINNYIVFNYLSYPTQVTSPNLIIEGFTNNTLKFHKFYWHNQVAYQYIKDQITLPLPAIVGYSSIYFKQHLFKKALELQIGLDAEFRSASYAYSYMPAIGSFYLQETEKLGNFPNLGFNISFRIKKLRGFVKFGNIINSFNHSRSYILLDTPYPPFSVNYGISWEFFD